MPLTPGTRLGPYEVTAQIGRGGMGEVYRARDRKLDRDVAIEVLPARSSPSGGSRKDHRQRTELALDGIQDDAEGFERHGTEQGAVSAFAKNHGRRATTPIHREQQVTLSTSDLGTVGQGEHVCGVWLHSEFEQRCHGHDGVDGTRVDEECDGECSLRTRRVCDLEGDVREAHRVVYGREYTRRSHPSISRCEQAMRPSPRIPSRPSGFVQPRPHAIIGPF